MPELDKRIRKLEQSIRWLNIYMILLCLALMGFSWMVWSKLLLHADAILEIADILKTKGLLP